MKLFVGILTLTLALVISAVAAYFSVVGLSAIFSATAGAVVLMGCALEAGKLTSAGWLHLNWSNPKVGKVHKGYMVSAVIALMIITALGIYGFLAKGHLEQQTPLAPIELQIGQKQAQIDQINADLTRLNTRQSQIDAAVNGVIGQDASKGLQARRSLNSENKTIQASIAADTTALNKLTTELVPLKLQINEVETKLGPVKYVADLFGLKDTEGAVRIVILIIMFAFDPLAIVLVLSSAISFADAFEERKLRVVGTGGSIFPEFQIDIPTPPVEDETATASEDDFAISDEEVAAWEAEVLAQQRAEEEAYLAALAAREQETKTEILHELEQHPNLEMTDKEHLLDILERKPELLQNIVEAVREDIENPSKNQSWLDSGLDK